MKAWESVLGPHGSLTRHGILTYAAIAEPKRAKDILDLKYFKMIWSMGKIIFETVEKLKWLMDNATNKY